MLFTFENTLRIYLKTLSALASVTSYLQSYTQNTNMVYCVVEVQVCVLRQNRYM